MEDEPRGLRMNELAEPTLYGKSGFTRVVDRPLIGRSVLDRQWYGVEPLLSRWEGEALYIGIQHEWPTLQRIGRPAVVVAALDLSTSTDVAYMSRDLATVFVSTEIDVGELGAEIHYSAPIPGDDVIDIWQPGSPEYDRHDKLPRA